MNFVTSEVIVLRSMTHNGAGHAILLHYTVFFMKWKNEITRKVFALPTFISKKHRLDTDPFPNIVGLLQKPRMDKKEKK